MMVEKVPANASALRGANGQNKLKGTLSDPFGNLDERLQDEIQGEGMLLQLEVGRDGHSSQRRD